MVLMQSSSKRIKCRVVTCASYIYNMSSGRETAHCFEQSLEENFDGNAMLHTGGSIPWVEISLSLNCTICYK